MSDIPTHTQIGEDLENLVNTTTWLLIDHHDGVQRVTATMPDGQLISASDTFVGNALRVVAEGAKDCRG